MQEKYGFVYIWYDSFRKKFYIGCHWGHVDDGYKCSSHRMRQAYKRRPDDFKRRILKTNIQKSDLFEEEFKWLQLIKPEELGKKYYNLRRHKWEHWSQNDNTSKTIGQKISAHHTGKKRGPMSEETKQKIRIANIGHFVSLETRQKLSKFNKGKQLSDDTKQKIQIARRNRKHTEQAKINMSRAQIGRSVSEETKQKLKKLNLGKKLSKETKIKIGLKSKNRIWWNNGNVFKFQKDIPEGENWVKGRRKE